MASASHDKPEKTKEEEDEPEEKLSFVEAATAFLGERSNFESSKLFEAMVADLEGARKVSEAFLAPIRHRLVGFQAALEWLYFVHHSGFTGTDGKPLRTTWALNQLKEVYDQAHTQTVDDHFVIESDSDEDLYESGSDEGSA